MKKKIGLTIAIIAFAFILIYDTYNKNFVQHEEEKTTLTVIYENTGNLILRNIHDGSSTSLRIRVKNETNMDKKYQLKFKEVYNPVEKKESITYSFSKENKSIELSSRIFPSEDITMYDGEVIHPGDALDYVFTVIVSDIDENDIGKSVQARIELEEI